MKNLSLKLIACLMLLLVCATAVAEVELRLPDGSRWRGDVQDNVVVEFTEQGTQIEIKGVVTKLTDQYLIIDGSIGGKTQQKLVFVADIVSMETSSADAAAGSNKTRANSNSGTRQRITGASNENNKASNSYQGVFLLPLHGPVGNSFRHDEIKMIGEHADKFGPGQIIVLHIKSNGGLVLESDRINATIHDVRKRHRVVAWIEKAISAGCSTAMACNEIYFMSSGTAGSVTTLSGGGSVAEEAMVLPIEEFAAFAEESGYSGHIARAMKLNKHMCSYDKDPETGEVTFYGDTSGEFVLSDANSNLTFNASNAEHCGFSKGTANTLEELAELLDLEEWREVDDYGRRIAKSWQDTCKKLAHDVPLLMARYGYKNTGGTDTEVVIGTRISILKDLIRWIDRAPLVMAVEYQMADKAPLEREIEELRRVLQRMRNRR